MYRCIFNLSADLLFIALFPHFIYISINFVIIIKYFPLNPLKGRNVFNVRAHRNILTFFIWHALAYTAAENSLLSFFSLAFYLISVLKELILNPKAEWYMTVLVKPAVYSHYWNPFQLSAVCRCLLAAPINNVRASVFC